MSLSDAGEVLVRLNREDLESFLGRYQGYSQGYPSDISRIIEPLRESLGLSAGSGRRPPLDLGLMDDTGWDDDLHMLQY
jgi:hypothetical protein